MRRCEEDILGSLGLKEGAYRHGVRQIQLGMCTSDEIRVALRL